MLKLIIDWWTRPTFRERLLAMINEFDFNPTAYQISERRNPKVAAIWSAISDAAKTRA
jgi:hypothetical protein